MINVVNKKDILRLVTREVRGSKKEIIATMLLREERRDPLPDSYHRLLKKKLKEGVTVKRLGFGRKEDYTVIMQRLAMSSKKYLFTYTPKVSFYQRLLIIDRTILFFDADGVFLRTTYKPLIDVFYRYFIQEFRKGNI